MEINRQGPMALFFNGVVVGLGWSFFLLMNRYELIFRHAP